MKMLKKPAVILGLIVLAIAIAGMYKFNYLASQPGYDVDGNKVESAIEVEKQEETEPVVIEIEEESELVETIYFDAEDGKWKDEYGVCNTCTPENGFGEDGQLIKDEAEEETKEEEAKPIVNDAPAAYFNEETKEWMDENGVCETCTPGNGFSKDGIKEGEEPVVEIVEEIVEEELDSSLSGGVIYFDAGEGKWKDYYGVCEACTPENGYGEDGELIVESEEPDAGSIAE